MKKSILRKIEEVQNSKMEELILEYEVNLTLPQEITGLTHLKKLSLFNSGLSSFPLFIETLPFLESLNLAFNQLKKIPETIKGLSHLRELYLAGNKIAQLPENIVSLQALEVLTLNHCPNLDLVDTIGKLARLQKLKELTLSCYTHFPEEIGLLTQFKKLTIQATPTPQKRLIIPTSIGKLESLEELSLAHLSLTELPESIGNLQNLEILDISDNQLCTLPNSLIALKKLKKLILKNNPIAAEPDDVESYYLSEHIGKDGVYYGDWILNDTLKLLEMELPRMRIIAG